MDVRYVVVVVATTDSVDADVAVLQSDGRLVLGSVSAKVA